MAGPSASSGANPYTVTVSGGQYVGGLYFQSSGSMATLSGTGSIYLGSGGITLPQYAYGTTAQGAVNISSQLSLQTSQTWSNSSTSSLLVSGNIISNGNSLILGGSGNVVISGGIIGADSVVASGPGMLTLASASAISGTVSMSGGTLDLAQGNALQLGTLIVPSPGGLLFDVGVANRQFSIGALSGSGSIALKNSWNTAGVTLSIGRRT